MPRLALLVGLTAVLSACSVTPEPTVSPGGTSFRPALALADCTAPAGPSLETGPWITGVDAGGASVSFTLSGEVDATVHFAPADTSGACTEEQVFGPDGKAVDAGLVQGAPFVDAGQPIPPRLYTARLETAASPGARRFCYGLELPPTAWQKVNRYFCPPDLGHGDAGTSFAVPPSSASEVTFYAYGDTRDPLGFNALHETVVRDMGYDHAADLVAGRDAATFVVNTGDFAYSGCTEEMWSDNFFSPTRVLLQHLPIFTAPGNHESYSTIGGKECPQASYYFAYFAPAYGGASHAPGLYSASYGNVHLISLNLISNDDQGGLDPASCKEGATCGDADLCGYKWLECRLLAAGADDAIDHVFVVFHAPLITAPPDGKHASNTFQIQHLAPLLERPDGKNPGKVTAVISGHNHFYERSVPLTDLCLTSDTSCRERTGASCPDGTPPSGFQFPPVCYREDPSTGITYVISGGGGATPYTAPPGPFPIQWLDNAASAYHYMKIRVRGRAATLEVRGFDGQGRPFADEAVLRR